MDETNIEVPERKNTEIEDLELWGARLDTAEGMIECARYLGIRDREGTLRPLEANPAQRAFEERRGRQNIVLKARQMGITTWISARFFLRTIAYPGTMTLQVAHTRQAAESIFRTVQRMWENLPEPLRTGRLKRRRANVGQMIFQEIDSEFRVASACDTGAGRGLSVQNLHLSEVSRWPGDAAETLAGLRAALAPQGELVIESTPSGAYGPFYKEWKEGMDEAGSDGVDRGGLVRHFLPWWLEPAYTGPPVVDSEMTEAEQTLVGLHRLSGEQIGFRRTLERSYGALRSQEFAEDAETCFRATGSCCFEIASIEQRMTEVDEPHEVRRSGALHYWWKPAVGRRYLVAVDSAGGGADGDFAAIQVVDRDTGAQCAELQQRLPPRELAMAAAELAREYGNAMIAVERNNHGGTVLALLEEREPGLPLYRERGQKGWLTTGASKPEMIARLGALLAERPALFKSRRLLSECRTYIYGEHGETKAASGAHDDLVMSMALAQMCRVQRVECRG